MDSRLDLTRISQLNEKTLGAGYNSSELDSKLTIDTTLSSTSFDSIHSSELTLTFHDDQNHVKGCAFKYRQCTCELLTRYKMRQEKRKHWTNHPNRELPLNDTINSTILAGNVGSTSSGTSQVSSDSFHSAQSITDDVHVVYTNIEDASSESTAGSLEMAVNASKPRDTNYNIDSNQDIEWDSEAPRVTSEIEEETLYIMPFLEKLSKEIDTSPPRINAQRSNLMKRLSMSFAKNPKEFAERLLTIIEETNLNSCEQPAMESCSNLSRLTTEFRKACKYIMKDSMIIDQSMPAEMLNSPTDSVRRLAPGILKSPVTPSASNPSPKRRSSVDFHTSIHEEQKNIKKVYRKTPKNLVKNTLKSNQSPLCIAILKKANGASPQLQISPTTSKMNRYSNCSSHSKDVAHEILTPGTDQSPQCNIAVKETNGTPQTPLGTSRNTGLNDSFIYWENYAHKTATPVSEGKIKSLLRRSKSVPDMAVEVASARIKRTGAIQYHCLDDSSPSLLYYKPTRKTSTENVLYDTFNSHPNYNSNLPESVLEEVMKKRLRCCQTEKMIREIDATIVSADDTPEDDIVLEYLKFVRRSSDYHKYLNENKDVINDAVKKIEEKRTIPTKRTQPLTKTFNRLVKPEKKVQPIMSGIKRPAFVVNFRRRSPCAVSKDPKEKPPVRSKQGETSLYLRGLSAKKTTSSTTSSAVRHPSTPKITNRKLALTRSTPNLALSPQPPALKLRPVSRGKTPSKPLSVTRTPSKLSVIRTPAKINCKNDLPASLTIQRSKILRTPNSVLTKCNSAQNLPVFSVTPSTPRSRTTTNNNNKKLAQSSQKVGATGGGRFLQTPSKSQQSQITYRAGKFFNTPATKSEEKTYSFISTPKTMPAKCPGFSKPRKYFETPEKPEEKKRSVIPSALTAKNTFVGSAVYFSYNTVKSPVAEYINSTDAKLVQNIRSKDNEFLLTPKVKQATASTETLRIKLGGLAEKKNTQSEPENDENTPDIPINTFPKVMYQPPAAVYDINCDSSSKLRGGHGKVLREVNQRRVVIRHEGRIRDNIAEQSIHVSKPAEKTNYVGYSQAAKKPLK